MKQKNIGKFLGIGAAILLFALTMAPIVSSISLESVTTSRTFGYDTQTQAPSLQRRYIQYQTKQQICSQFFTQHQSDLATIEMYLESIDIDNPPEEYPAEIQTLITTLSEQLEFSLRFSCEDISHLFEDSIRIPSTPSEPSEPFNGFSRYLTTSEPITIEGEDYIGHCWAIDNDVTGMFRFILDNYGAPAALVYLTAIVCAVAPPPFGLLFAIYILNHKDEIVDLIPTINQGHGIRFWIFDSVYHVSFLYNICYVNAQPGTCWLLPVPWYVVWDI